MHVHIHILLLTCCIFSKSRQGLCGASAALDWRLYRFRGEIVVLRGRAPSFAPSLDNRRFVVVNVVVGVGGGCNFENSF